ncbi:hypothetical protein [Oryzihumus leptocrescens]|uniref:hypothetical protein n=1 Tax=Oryzihumus leptocrescens TaxID=297536 RepID=UPI001FE4FF99|nr:hypothetical protein [Oryzihumus leptocrescens]
MPRASEQDDLVNGLNSSSRDDLHDVDRHGTAVSVEERLDPTQRIDRCGQPSSPKLRVVGVERGGANQYCA